MKHFSYIILALCAPFAALAQRTEAGGASGFAPGAHASRTLSAEWAASNHVRQASAYDDYDGDLLENWAEEALGTSPWTNDLTSANAASAAALGALDLVPARWKAAHGFSFADVVGDADTDNDGWDNWSEWMSGSDPRDATSRPDPTLRATVDLGRLAARGKLVVHAYSHEDMNGWPDAVYVRDLPANASASVTVVDLRDADLVYGHLRQGTNWFFAWTNEDGSNLASVNGGDWPTWTDPEPAAIADNQLDGIDIGFDRNEVTFHLTDKAESFARVSWEDKVPEDTAGYRVLIQSPEFFFASDGMPAQSPKKSIMWPRTWIHEGDIISYNRMYGTGNADFGLGAYAPASEMFAEDSAAKVISVKVSTETAARQTSNFDSYVPLRPITNWTHATLPKPVLYGPVGGELVTRARPEFKFRLDPEYTEFQFTLKQGSTTIYDGRVLAPGRFWNDATGRRDLVIWKFPYGVGDTIDGEVFDADAEYTWSVKAYSPALRTGAAAQTSVNGAFRAAAGAAGAICAVVSATNWSGKCSAYPAPSCNGQPEAASAIAVNGLHTLAGLDLGRPYFVRCQDDNGNIGFIGGRRPVPVFAEIGTISITNEVTVRSIR